MRNLLASGLISRIRFAFVVMVVAAIAGCGGGGGGGSTSTSTTCLPFSTGCSTSGSGTGGTTTASAAVTLSILSNGKATTILPSTGSVTVQALVTDTTGAVAKSKLVTFSADSTLAKFVPSTGTALTDSNGIATVSMSAASLSAAGAGIVTATATVDGTTAASGTAAFQVGAATIELGAPAITSTLPISSYGTTTITMKVKVNGVEPTEPVTVYVSSSCATQGKATLPASVQTVSGTATVTYTDKGCGTSDTVTLSAFDKSTSTVITSLTPAAANIRFVSATPSLIAIRGTAGLPDVANVVFQVVDASGNPVASKTVGFSLTSWTGGITLQEQTQAQVNALGGFVNLQTAADGTVTVSVKAGTNPASVYVNAKILATATTPELVTQSNKLVIAGGPPTQDRFSLSVGTHNIEGWDYDGVTTGLNVYAFDRVGNPVPDGTTVNFITEGAGTLSKYCSTTDATCSVNFASGERRPLNEYTAVCSNYSDATTCSTSGRVTVVAYALGEEGFDDAGGDNIYTNEVFRDLGEVFIDSNENGKWDDAVVSGGVQLSPPEQYIPLTGSLAGTSACPTPGGYANAKSKLNTCNGSWGQAQVRRDAVIVLSGSWVKHLYAMTANLGTLGSDVINASPVTLTDSFGMTHNDDGTIKDALSCMASFAVRISDINNNPMPAGTTVSLADNNVQYSQLGTPDLVTAVATSNESVINDTIAAGGTIHTFTLKGSKCVSVPAGRINLVVATPKGNKTTIPIDVKNNL